MSRIELTIAGLGGQGSILAGGILGEAAVAFDGKYAVQTQAYSSELRGGYAATWVVISDTPVVFPRVIHPDIIVAQAQDAINRFGHTLKPHGILLADSDMIPSPPGNIDRFFNVPATSIARNRVKAPLTANIVMLGALHRVAGIVTREALEKAIVERVPKGKEQMNLTAFQLGFETVDCAAGLEPTW